MTLTDLGNLGEFVGAIAVVISLLYLAAQIRQNTAALRTASRQHIVSGYRDHNRLFFERGCAEAYAEGLSRFPEMPLNERSIFGYLLADHAVYFQGVFALYESGTLEEEIYRAYLDWFACHLATPGGSAWWAQFRSTLTPRRMVEAVGARLAQGDLPDITELSMWRLDDPPALGSPKDHHRAGA